MAVAVTAIQGDLNSFQDGIGWVINAALEVALDVSIARWERDCPALHSAAHPRAILEMVLHLNPVRTHLSAIATIRYQNVVMETIGFARNCYRLRI